MNVFMLYAVMPVQRGEHEKAMQGMLFASMVISQFTLKHNQSKSMLFPRHYPQAEMVANSGQSSEANTMETSAVQRSPYHSHNVTAQLHDRHVQVAVFAQNLVRWLPAHNTSSNYNMLLLSW